jgi:catechol 2,3-dioxygenase-like lactoylglutathione lyase family enzyme
MSGPDRPLRLTSLSSVGLRTPDVDRAARFYERVVGLIAEPERSPEGGIRLGWGSGRHALELLPGPAGLDHVALEVGDEADDALVEARGAVDVRCPQADGRERRQAQRVVGTAHAMNPSGGPGPQRLAEVGSGVQRLGRWGSSPCQGRGS